MLWIGLVCGHPLGRRGLRPGKWWWLSLIDLPLTPSGCPHHHHPLPKRRSMMILKHKSQITYSLPAADIDVTKWHPFEIWNMNSNERTRKLSKVIFRNLTLNMKVWLFLESPFVQMNLANSKSYSFIMIFIATKKVLMALLTVVFMGIIYNRNHKVKRCDTINNNRRIFI